MNKIGHMPKKRILSYFLLAVIVLTVLFIWSRSMKSATESNNESQTLLNMIWPLISFFAGAENATQHLIRKLAHFTEFACLGVEIAAYAKLRFGFSVQKCINCMFAGLLVALTDETIQIFTGRGASVSDVWLDFSGFVFGALVAAAVCGIIHLLRKRAIDI